MNLEKALRLKRIRLPASPDTPGSSSEWSPSWIRMLTWRRCGLLTLVFMALVAFSSFALPPTLSSFASLPSETALSVRANTTHEICRVSESPHDPLAQEYGAFNVRLSRSYEGSGHRVRRLLKRALEGEPLRIGIVGGSVSTGHGVLPPFSAENHMHLRITKWLETTFSSSQVSLDRGAVLPAQTNLYFSYCLFEHLPRDVNLVLVELDINSLPQNRFSTEATESLFRSILELPSQPAVIALSTFGLVFEDMISGWANTIQIVQWYDVPMINLRNWLLPYLTKNPAAVKTFFTNFEGVLDTRHINKHGHVAMGDMVIAYLREQLCYAKREMAARVSLQPSNSLWPALSEVSDLPRLGYYAKWDESSRWTRSNPRCQSINSKDDPLLPVESNGWLNTTYNDKMFYEAYVAGSQVTFELETSGKAGMHLWRTADPAFGSVQCWIDNETAPHRLRTVNAHNANQQAALFEWSGDIFDDLVPGKHTMTCKLLNGIFRIQGLVTR